MKNNEAIECILKTKCSLSDKFMFISSALCAADTEENDREFVRVKTVRDKFLHGEYVEEESFPIAAAQNLTQKYLKLHFAYTKG